MKEEIVNLFGCCVQRWHKKTEVVKNLVNWRDAVHCSMCDEKKIMTYGMDSGLHKHDGVWCFKRDENVVLEDGKQDGDYREELGAN